MRLIRIALLVFCERNRTDHWKLRLFDYPISHALSRFGADLRHWGAANATIHQNPQALLTRPPYRALEGWSKFGGSDHSFTERTPFDGRDTYGRAKLRPCISAQRLERPRPRMLEPVQRTRLGRYFVGDSKYLLRGPLNKALRGKVQLILTSPPYPLNRKKSYGNHTGPSYKRWFLGLAPLFADLLRPDGSIVIELGNAWLRGRPVQSLLHLESLLGFVQAPSAGLRLCQQFICYNPARLPTPAAWVTVKRLRVTDSFTHVWWMAKSDFPKADNSRVLRPYSQDMRDLLQRGKYNNGRRPSHHGISKKGFLRDNGGSIAQNVLEVESLDPLRPSRVPNVLRIANTSSNDFFFRECRAKGVTPHPARMPSSLASFFVHFLTDPGDLVLDPFAGSNTTGFVSELGGRRWVAIDQVETYVKQSRIRFRDPQLKGKKLPKKTRRISR